MRTFMLFLCFLLCGLALTAQELPPNLVVRLDNGKEEALTVKKIDTVVRVVGTLAETSMTMTFFNPNARQLEGQLYFPLPPGATISGYALDINGTLVDGVVVEKDKGRQVFETEVRKGIDPGLIEWVKGNHFKTRVYPIPARGTRTVMVKFVAELAGGQDERLYVLPLRFKGTVESCSIRMEVLKSATKPEIRDGGLANFAFNTWNEGFMAETTLSKAELDKDLRIAIPDALKQTTFVETSPDNETFFCVNYFPEAPETVTAAPAVTPSTVTIFWDASASREKADQRAALAFLRAYFGRHQNRPISVQFTPFRNALGKATAITVQNGNISALEEAIKAIDYDGGTQMGCLAPVAGSPKPDLYFLFTDGISNFGVEEPARLDAPLYVFSTDAAANHPFLTFVAAQNGGEYVKLFAAKPDQIAATIGTPVFSFISATLDGKAAPDVYPQIPQPVRERLSFAGKLNGSSGKLTLNFGTNGVVSKTIDVEISAAKPASGDFLKRFWAQKKIEDLLVFPQKNEKEIIATGKKYSIVTPGTSLIVLENIGQYIEHEIVPPAAMKQWRTEYFDVMEKRVAQQKKTELEKINEIVPLWQQRVTWWNTEFKVPENYKDTAKKMRQGPGSLSRPESAQSDSFDGVAAQAPSPAMESAGEMEKSSVMPSSLAGAPAESKKADASEKESAPAVVEPGVAMKAWNPQTPYIKNLQAAAPEKIWGVYMKERQEYGNSPAFFLDCADFFIKAKDADLGLQVLSNLAELELENPALMRVLAHRLSQLEHLELSALVFEEVLKLRPEEPQSYRDLALVLGRLGKFERAVSLLYDIVKKRWDGRFPEIEVIALMELNNLLEKAKRANVTVPEIDSRLVKNLEVDLRIIMTWDADLTDMDLWVTEPTGEKTYYGSPRSMQGGNVSRDFTQGYGPEEYCLKKAMRGMYKVETNFFGSRAQSLSGAVTLQAEVFSNFGRPNEKRRTITLRLTESRETFTVADVEF